MEVIDIVKISPENWLDNEAICMEIIKDVSNLSNIPLLNCAAVHDFADNSLVRFRGMIQDMFNPELFMEKYEILNTTSDTSRVQLGKYRDTTRCGPNESINLDDESAVKGERQSMFMISVPGLNPWALEEELLQNKTKKYVQAACSPSLKRSLDDAMDCEAGLASESSECKRVEKKIVNGAAPYTHMAVSPEFILNSPLPDRPSKACIIKVYDMFDSYKLNDILEVVGFLSVDPLLGVDMVGDEDHGEDLVHNPPPSLVPRIHVVHVRPLKHCNPLLSDILENANVLDWAKKVRNDLHLSFTQALLGDELAADYLICHLISNVYMRKDLFSLGQFALNLSNVPLLLASPGGLTYISQLYGLLEYLLPVSHYLPLTIDTLNSAAFLPKKDYETDRLVSGVLQLARGSHLVLDETQLQAGSLDSSGVNSLSTLRTLIKDQRLSYDFKYYPMEYECDIPVLVLSEGRSLLHVDIQVPIEADAAVAATIFDVMSAVKHYLGGDVLLQARRYMSAMKLAEFTVSDHMQVIIQNDFVVALREKRSTADDLHAQLVFARLLSLSRGECNMTEQIWNLSRDLEQSRKARIVSSTSNQR